MYLLNFVLWIYVVQYTGATSFYVSHSMYAVPYNQISTTNPIQKYALSPYQVNVSLGEYVAIGFGKTTDGSPCQVIPGNSTFTNANGGANQTYLVGSQGSSSFSSLPHDVAISHTILTSVQHNIILLFTFFFVS